MLCVGGFNNLSISGARNGSAMIGPRMYPKPLNNCNACMYGAQSSPQISNIQASQPLIPAPDVTPIANCHKINNLKSRIEVTNDTCTANTITINDKVICLLIYLNRNPPSNYIQIILYKTYTIFLMLVFEQLYFIW